MKLIGKVYFRFSPVYWILLLLLLGLLVSSCSESGFDATDGDKTDGDVDAVDGDEELAEIVLGKLKDCDGVMPEPPKSCSNCHKAPPDKPHMPNNKCYRCHGYVIDKDYNFIDNGLHNNGTVEYAVGCSSCHGWGFGMSPPESLAGMCGDGAIGIGGHDLHRKKPIPAHQTNCSNCHTIPLSLDEIGHLDGDNKAEVRFKYLAAANGAKPAYDPETHTCSGIYCHGTTLQGGTYTKPNWLDVSGRSGKCGACHRLTDPKGNKDADCFSCHSKTLDKDGNILPRGVHINGVIDHD